MIDTIAREKEEGEIGWREVIHNGSQRTFQRILLGMGVNIFQQIGGVNVVVSESMHQSVHMRIER